MNELYHHGIKGMRWGVRRYQNADGSYTEEGKRRRRDDGPDIRGQKKLNPIGREKRHGAKIDISKRETKGSKEESSKLNQKKKKMSKADKAQMLYCGAVMSLFILGRSTKVQDFFIDLMDDQMREQTLNKVVDTLSTKINSVGKVVTKGMDILRNTIEKIGNSPFRWENGKEILPTEMWDVGLPAPKKH